MPIPPAFWYGLGTAALVAVAILVLWRNSQPLPYERVKGVADDLLPPDPPQRPKGPVCPRCKNPSGDVIRLAEIRAPFPVGAVIRDEVSGYRYACQRCPCIFNATGAGTWDVCPESYPYTPERSKAAPREELPAANPRAQAPRPRSAPNV